MGKKIIFILNILLTLAILLNLNWLKTSYLGVILSLPYLVIFGYLLGKIIFLDKEKSWQILLGTFSLLSIYSFVGAIVYYIYRLDQLVISIIFAFISGLILYFARLQIADYRSQLSSIKFQSLFISLRSVCRSLGKGRTTILTLTYILLFAIAISILFFCQTTDAIRSIWQIIPKAFFLIYFLATLNLLLLLFKSKAASCNLIIISLHFFLSSSIALIIYKLGFGFDPFIHRATELAIFNQGMILPKPFYYLGQYSLVIFLSHLLQVSVEWIDKLLLPALLSIFLPYTIYTSLTKTFNWVRNNVLILCLIFLILPFELFIAATPQALANLFSLIILFLSLLYLKDKQLPFYYLIFLALVTLAIHALAGIPILIYLIIIWLRQLNNKPPKIILPIFSLAAIFALPAALIINSLISIYKVQFSWNNFNLISLPTIFSRQYNFFLDLAYLYKNCIHLLLLAIAILAIYKIIKNHLASIFIPCLLTFLILVINAIFLNFIKVSFIIDYEQGEFSQRVLQLAFYFLLPIVIYGFYLVLEKAASQPFIYMATILLILSLFLSLSLYLSYPRFDDYDNSKFINLSQADLEAVQFIEQNSNNQPYIVLANQMTSAAALKTYGFTRYYNGQYFYPIPTGANLYNYFEQMIYQTPDKETMIKAMDLAEVNIAYFALPAYWSRYQLIIGEASKYADAIYSLDDKVMIFKYFR